MRRSNHQNEEIKSPKWGEYSHCHYINIKYFHFYSHLLWDFSAPFLPRRLQYIPICSHTFPNFPYVICCDSHYINIKHFPFYAGLFCTFSSPQAAIYSHQSRPEARPSLPLTYTAATFTHFNRQGLEFFNWICLRNKMFEKFPFAKQTSKPTGIF